MLILEGHIVCHHMSISASTCDRLKIGRIQRTTVVEYSGHMLKMSVCSFELEGVSKPIRRIERFSDSNNTVSCLFVELIELLRDTPTRSIVNVQGICVCMTTSRFSYLTL